MVRLLLRPSRPASSPTRLMVRLLLRPSRPASSPDSSRQQGRQDLNLQPAVLETAALPVELRPFAGWQANLRVPGLPNARALQLKEKRAGNGKTPRSECTSEQVSGTNHAVRTICPASMSHLRLTESSPS